MIKQIKSTDYVSGMKLTTWDFLLGLSTLNAKFALFINYSFACPGEYTKRFPTLFCYYSDNF